MRAGNWTNEAQRHWLRTALLAMLALLWACGADAAGVKPRNIIIMIADGAAATQWDFGRYSSRVLRGEPFAATDIVLRQGALGLLITAPNNGYITDSAAAASAMSTGHKANVGALSVTPDGKAPATLMEAARASGRRTGIVTTSTVYDATPAAFTIHAPSRTDAQAIVDRYAAFAPDVLLGGGADYFLPSQTGGKRSDGADLIAVFRSQGYAIATNAAELAAARSGKLLGLFAGGDMALEIDRDAAREPSTARMAEAALRALERDKRGFVLLVENENVDTAGHTNDAASLMRALWAFDDAVKVALEFQRRFPDTLVIIAGDHESGGFSPTYAARDFTSRNRVAAADAELRMLERSTMSLSAVAARLGSAPSAEMLDQLIERHLPAFKLDADLRDLIVKKQPMERNAQQVTHVLGRMVARHTGYYWGTSGHTSQPVVIGAFGPGAEVFRGYQDNTEFGRRLHQLLAKTTSPETKPRSAPRQRTTAQRSRNAVR
jgi:alkaline phosphatase